LVTRPPCWTGYQPQPQNLRGSRIVDAFERVKRRTSQAHSGASNSARQHHALVIGESTQSRWSTAQKALDHWACFDPAHLSERECSDLSTAWSTSEENNEPRCDVRQARACGCATRVPECENKSNCCSGREDDASVALFKRSSGGFLSC
jgi:hypothetical protein